ncbi:MAG: extracellular solute-binding protein [Nocardioidaceae bacterium]|nr:extracellular solute-binding protein [Nocardioidaceae bacterium]MCL2613311.1 extracellular solute-binding protein [Nocardioidaceae bacterium]
MSLISRKVRRAATAVGAVSLLLSAAACSNNNSSDAHTLTMWTNVSPGPGLDYLNNTIKTFESQHSGYTIKLKTMADTDLDGALQTAMQGGASTAPDIYLQRGGGKLKAQVQAGQVADISGSLSAQAKQDIVASSYGPEQVDGKTYAVPVAIQPGGFFYSKNLFKQAGITSVPTTVAQLEAADAKLKGKGITPIAVGAKDGWPAAHWYYWFALRDCSQGVLNSTAQSLKFTDACWTKAGDDLKAFIATNPWEKGYIGIGQQGAGSSAALMANHKASMELMGGWDPGVIAGLTPNKKPLPDLSFFPMVQVPGGKGSPTATMGGVDAYSCSKWAPSVCTDFLNLLATTAQQTAYSKAFQTVPANTQSQKTVTDPLLKAETASVAKAPYVSFWLDSLYGQNVGTALNTSVVNLFTGKGTVADIISTVNAAGAKG